MSRRSFRCNWAGPMALWLAWTVGSTRLAAAPASEPALEGLDFFEARVRPILVERCYPCHSAASGKAKGGLRLDTRDATRKGGDTGPALVPGDPDASLLVRAIRYADEALQMPPPNAGGRLTPEHTADLVAWVQAGAPDPRTNATTAVVDPQSRARTHWAFQPIRKPELPRVRRRGWIQTPVDRFVLAQLESRGLKPAPPADRRTLLRRLHYDLVGLPPTMAEVEAFAHDRSTDAVVRVVERLLASPHYGERWGRRWLDVARYADTKGYVFQEERRYPFSHTYRDYVIRAFNEDKPFDRFLVEQIAADHLELGEDRSALAALGFLTLGRRFLNNTHDIIDDRIDLVTRGTLGLTVSCARCHDHKFDPISMRDYYALHGVFHSSEEPAEKPLLGPSRASPEQDAFQRRKAEIEAQIADEARRQVRRFLGEERARSGDYLLAAHDARATPTNITFETFAGERQVNPVILRRWLDTLGKAAAGKDPVLGPWLAFTVLPDTHFTAAAAELCQTLRNDPQANPRVVQAITEPAPASLKELADAYNRLFQAVDKSWQTILDAPRDAGRPAPTALPDPAEEAIRLVLWADHAPPQLPFAEAEALIQRRIENETVKFRQQIEALNWTHPGAPLRAMALVDRPNPQNSHIFLRGNPANPGPEVPRRFLEVLGGNEHPFTQGSGRLELARAIVHPDNPLTGRVFVNRVWAWHFGAPLVRTPSDFGVRTEPPVHRDLLDWLAATFREGGWSVKQLHRLLVLSSTYQQSCDHADKQAATSDPDNQWLHHARRQRLDLEALRDTLLAVSGQIDLAVGGLPVELWTAPFPRRRTVYGFIDRQNLPGTFRTFDFPNPDTSSAGRFQTTVPQQGLFLLNSPFVVEQARHLASRPEVRDIADETERVQALYRLLYQRPATREELRLAREFLHAAPVRLAGADTLPPWEQFAQVLLLSNELAFVD